MITHCDICGQSVTFCRNHFNDLTCRVCFAWLDDWFLLVQERDWQ